MQARDFFDTPPATEPAAREPQQPRRTEAPQPAVAPAAQAAPVVFHAVSEHDTTVVPEEHKPVRRRRHGPSDEAAQAPLQLVETQADAPIVAAPPEDDLPRRSRPRKRRGGPVANEPLMLVETQGGTEGARPDNQP